MRSNRVASSNTRLRASERASERAWKCGGPAVQCHRALHACSHASAGKDCPDRSDCAQHANTSRPPDVTPHRSTEADSYLSHRLLKQRGHLPRCSRAADTAYTRAHRLARACTPARVLPNTLRERSTSPKAEPEASWLPLPGTRRARQHSLKATTRSAPTSQQTARWARRPVRRPRCSRTDGGRPARPAHRRTRCSRADGGRPAHRRKPCVAHEPMATPAAATHSTPKMVTSCV